MGFPEWTLWGMGLSIAGALVALVLSLLGQSPGALRRLGLGGSRLELRIRALTGYALALLLLAIGFFIAGVPLGPQTNQDTPSAQLTSAAAGTADTGVAAAGLPTEPISTESLAGSTATPATPETGAFGGPPPETVLATAPAITITETVQAGGPVSPTTSVIGVTGTPTAPPTATPTSTPTPTPEATPTPSLTPTPIAGDTAVVATGGSTIWLLRSPGGQNLALMHDADIVILLPGHANQGGVLWREVSALSGIHGWIQEEFLVISD